MQQMQETQVRSLGREDPWRRKWQPTPAFLLGKSHGQRSLVGYSPWGHKVSDTTEWQTAQTRKKTPILKVCCFDVCPPGGDLSKETETKIQFSGNSHNCNVYWAILAGLALYWILKRISLCLQGAYQALFSKVLWFRPFFSLLIQSVSVFLRSDSLKRRVRCRTDRK